MKPETETRIQFKSTPEEKQFLMDAAKSYGFRNLSEFIRVSAFEKARAYMQNQAVQYNRTLSKDDSMQVAQDLINPPEPNQKLIDLINKQKKEK